MRKQQKNDERTQIKMPQYRQLETDIALPCFFHAPKKGANPFFPERKSTAFPFTPSDLFAKTEKTTKTGVFRQRKKGVCGSESAISSREKSSKIATKYIFLTMSVFLLALRFEVC